jgi:hypothetical protein
MDRLGCALALLSGLVVLLASGCGSAQVTPQDTQSSAAAQGTAVAQPSSSPIPTPAVAALKSASVTQDLATATGGFTCAVKVTIWDRLPQSVQAPVAHPACTDATIDPTSDYDPKTDIVIPFEFTLKNTTKGFDLQDPSIEYRFVSSVRDVKRSLDESRTLDSLDWYDSGWDVTSWTVDLNEPGNTCWVRAKPQQEGSYPTMTWSTSLAPGESVSHFGFFVYRDKRTPAEPSGSAWTLKYLSVRVLYNDSGYMNGVNVAKVMREPSLTGEPGLFDLTEW